MPRQTSPDLTLPLAQPITLTRASHCLAVDPIVASHGGRIVKTTGDGVLLELSHVECGIAFPGSWRSAMPSANGMVEFENGTTVGRQISQPIPRVIEVRAG